MGEIDMIKESSLNTNLKVLFVGKPFILGICKCPCGESISVRTKQRLLQRIKHGHNWKIRENNPSKKGAKSIHWTGGLIDDGDGYMLVYSPNHPNKNAIGYVRQHRLIYENYLSILFDEEVFIPKGYNIHHIIPIKEGGTNALINLQLVTQKEHMKYHPENNKKDMSNRTCLSCGSNTTYVTKKENWPVWYKHRDGFLCKKCGDLERKKK